MFRKRNVSDKKNYTTSDKNNFNAANFYLIFEKKYFFGSKSFTVKNIIIVV